MRICSLLPSATEMIAQLGLIDSLVGVSDECRWPSEVVGKPIVTAAKIDPSTLSNLEIDSAVRNSLLAGASLYSVDVELMQRLEPDLIITQDLCAVCAVSSGELASACPAGTTMLSLDPRNLSEVADSVRILARAVDRVDRGEEIVAEMWATIHEAADAVRELPPKRIFFAEWIEPPFSAGHWLPEMIELAGGVDVLGNAGQPSRPVTWDAVAAAAPELVIMAPCGFDADAAAARAEGIPLPCPAIAVDGDSYYSRPGPRLAAGVAQLAHLLHPENAPDPGLPAIPLRVPVHR
ncbi:MAG TPA: ABC transporter substrate-binding protein [Gaiellaceae bacterium]|jgi:iron complex transport system substrate-binding protein|nr:ABC transporter substrate-binding protein [Gaiellaceae bacterium]